MQDKISLLQLAQKGKAVRKLQKDYFALRGQMNKAPGNKEIAGAAAATLVKSKNAEKEFDQLIDEIMLADEYEPRYMFAKIFNYPEGQLLVTKSFDEDNDRDTLVFTFDNEGLIISKKLSSPGEFNVDRAFYEFEEPKAKEMFLSLYKLSKGEFDGDALSKTGL